MRDTRRRSGFRGFGRHGVHHQACVHPAKRITNTCPSALIRVQCELFGPFLFCGYQDSQRPNLGTSVTCATATPMTLGLASRVFQSSGRGLKPACGGHPSVSSSPPLHAIRCYEPVSGGTSVGVSGSEADWLRCPTATKFPVTRCVMRLFLASTGCSQARRWRTSLLEGSPASRSAPHVSPRSAARAQSAQVLASPQRHSRSGRRHDSGSISGHVD